MPVFLFPSVLTFPLCRSAFLTEKGDVTYTQTLSKTALIFSFLGCKGRCAGQPGHSYRFASVDRLSTLLGSFTSSMRL